LKSLFIDLRKAFDSVPHTALWLTLERMKLPIKIVAALKEIHREDKAFATTCYGDTDSFIPRTADGLFRAAADCHTDNICICR